MKIVISLMPEKVKEEEADEDVGQNDIKPKLQAGENRAAAAQSQDQASIAAKHYDFKPVAQPASPLPLGTPAPDFTLRSTPDQYVSLHDFRGRPVVLVFYPADFSPVCGDEMVLFNEILPELEQFNAQLFGISVDNIWSHLAFAKHRNLRFPLLSDFNPKGEVAQRYGVYRQQDGQTERALFAIDKEGIVRWSYVSPIGVNPGVNGMLTALESLDKQNKADKVGAPPAASSQTEAS